MMPKVFQRNTALLLFVLMLALCLPGVAEITIEMNRQETDSDRFVSYPQLTGLDNSLIQEKINSLIMQEGQIQEQLNTLLVLSSGVPGRLQVNSEARIFPSASGHPVLAVLIRAEGRMQNGRNGHSYTPMMFDISTGEMVSWEMLFQNPGQAATQLEELALNSLGDELSNYLDTANLVPFPHDRVLITDSGLTFYYPENSLIWLSGRSASVHFHYDELRQLLNLNENSLLFDLGIKDTLNVQENSAENISNSAKNGKLPGLDAKVGDMLDDLINKHRLLHDPDGFLDGEQYQLEDDLYRGTVLITQNDLTISGILTTRINLFGLITGQTSREDATLILGLPVNSLSLDQSAAELYGVSEGTVDLYRYGPMDLQLFYDQDGLLSAVWLRETE